MCLNFNVNQAMALALVAPRRHAVGRGHARPRADPEDAQLGNFVRNHDEWSLDKLSDAERKEVFAAFGPDPDMQLFGRACAGACPPCSAAIRRGFGWPTASCSRCRARRSCSTARRSAWPRISRSKAG